MVAFPNAKINIGLNIVEKRIDGFHNIESCFYPVPCCDVLEILPAKTTTFKTDGISIPGDENSNLCLKAYNVLNADFDLPNFSFHLLKVIPIGAGLGGGSADGAFALKLINEMAGLNLSINQLEFYAKKLGSDCAFFIENKPKYCFEKGDVFMATSLDLSGKYLVLVNPNIHISTAEAYAGVKPMKSSFNYKNIANTPIENWKINVKNDFENRLFPKYPILQEIKNELYHVGAQYASMTGSGSTLYGIFEGEPSIDFFEKYWCFKTKL